MGALDILVDWDISKCVFLVTKDQSRLFKLHHSNGGGIDDYDVFTICNNIDSAIGQKYLITDMTDFISGSAIRLGMHEGDFLHKFDSVDWKIYY